MRTSAIALAAALIGTVSLAARADEPLLRIDAGAATAPVSPMLYGLMTEEINHSYDGGIYAELVQNRTFQDDPVAPVHWSLVQDAGGTATMALDDSQPIPVTALTRCLKLTATSAKPGRRVGIANDGYWGIPVRPNTTYKASFWARADSATAGALSVGIESNDGSHVWATGKCGPVRSQWQKFSVVLKTSGRAPVSADNRLVIATERPETVCFNLVSLFPPTYNNRPNGNRIDLMQKLVAMKPAFLRLPGGNYLEGETIETRFPWKKTLGPLEQRPGHPGTWKYRSSDGMGLLEYMEWCEDMHAEPVLAVFAGYALGKQHVDPGPPLQPFVDEALEEIEYVTGQTSTKWGAERARDGHPAPFKLTYVEIGNEDGFDTSGSYDRRFAQFFDAIRAKYPALKIIATIGGKDNLGRRQKLTLRTPDAWDEHYYRSAFEMEADAGHYDGYSRTGPKVFVGEWATREGAPTTNMNAALGDAAWMCGMERNSDVVTLASYAPLFVNVSPGAMQWRSDLIGYDALNSYGSPSYYAQLLFSNYHGDTIAPLLTEEIPTQTWQPPTPRNGKTPAPRQVPTLFATATRSSADGTIYLKVVNTLGAPQPVRLRIDGAKSVGSDGTAITLSSAAPTDTNTISEPEKIVPVTTKATGLGALCSYTFAPYSITVLILPAQ